MLIFAIIRIFFVYTDNTMELCLLFKLVFMLKTWHISFSAGDEVLCRDEDDFNYLFNCIALAVARNDASLLADSEMATHFHMCPRAENPLDVFHAVRYAYSRYFNQKYHRKGRLGELQPFIIELKGLCHTIAALTYVLRNALHHGVCPTPFGYPYNSSRCIFAEELGFVHSMEPLAERNVRRLMPAHVRCPSGYRMTKSGIIIRESVIDVADVEHLYGTPRSYLYHMNRLSSEEWTREQTNDRNGLPPVTLEMIEAGMPYRSEQELRNNEFGKFDHAALTYTQVCSIIQKEILRRYSKESVYVLSAKEVNEIANWLYYTYRLSTKMIARCLALGYGRK
jgi:hypothetical protein